MLPIHQNKPRLITAGILLLNCALVSCYKDMTIKPLKKSEKAPAVAINQEHRQPRIEAFEVQELPIVPYMETVMQENSEGQQYVKEKEKHRPVQQLKPVQQLTGQGQQELHTSIVQTLQNPIWKRYLLNGQLTTAQLLPHTHLQLSPMQGHYQLALAQESLQLLAPMLSLKTREGYCINFIQDMGYWWGVVRDNSPGFSRDVALPVLYPTHTDREQEILPIQHTLEALIQMPAAVQQQLVHIFSQDRSLKNGFVYTGEKLGLMGGGCCKNTKGQAKKAQVMRKAEVTEKAITKEEKEARNQTEELKKFMEAKKTDKVTGETYTLPEEEKRAIGVTGKAIKDISSPQGYKILPSILSTFDQHQTENLDNIKKLDEEFGKPFINNPKYAEYILPQDKAYFDKCIEDREKHRKYLEQARKDIIKKAEEQAEASFKEVQKTGEIEAELARERLDNMSSGMAAAQVPDDTQSAIDKIKANIDTYENFKKEVVLFPSILQKVDAQLQKETARLRDFSKKAETIKKIRQSAPEDITGKAAAMQNMAQTTNPVEIKRQVKAAISAGSWEVLEIAFRDKGVPVQGSWDLIGNTLLHLAVEANKVEIVDILLKYRADKFIQNKKKKSPLDLATKSEVDPKIKQLLGVK
jgi:hypothetical protein